MVVAVFISPITFILAGVCIGFGCYTIILYLRLKKQFLRFDNDKFSGKIMYYRGTKLIELNNKLSFIKGAEVKGKLLILINERNEKLSIINIVNPKDFANKINELLKSNNLQ